MRQGNKTSYVIKRTVFLCLILVAYLFALQGFTPLLKSVFVYNLPSPKGTAYTDTWRFYEQYIEYADMLTTYLKHKDKEITVDSELFVTYAKEQGIQSKIRDEYAQYTALTELSEIFGEIEKKVGKAEKYSAVQTDVFFNKLFGLSIKNGSAETREYHTEENGEFATTEAAQTTSPSKTVADKNSSKDKTDTDTGVGSEKINAYLKKYGVNPDEMDRSKYVSSAEELLAQYKKAFEYEYDSIEDEASDLYNIYANTVVLYSEMDLLKDYSPESIEKYFTESLRNIELKFFSNLKSSFSAAEQGINNYSNFKYIFFDKLTGRTESNFYSGEINPNNLLSIGDSASQLSWMLIFSSEQGLKLGMPVYEGSKLTIAPSQHNNNDLVSNAINSLQKFCSDRYVLYLALPQQFEQVDQVSVPYADYNVLANNFNTDLIIFIIGFIISIILSIAFILTSGESKDGGRLYFIDRIYNDVHFTVSGAIIVSMLIMVTTMTKTLMNNTSIAFASSDSPIYRFAEINQSFNLVVPSAMMIASAAALELFSSISRNTRLKRLYAHSLTAKFFALVGRIFRKLFKLIKRLCAFIFKPFIQLMEMAKTLAGDSLKTLKKNLLFYGLVYVGVNGLLILFTAIMLSQVFGYGMYGEFVIILIGLIVAFNAACLYKIFNFIGALDGIAFAASEIAHGRYDIVLDPSKMPRPLMGLARDIMNINEGTKTAVEAAVKGERLKAELITNVSHDLKTPLTSIVNYVDLLQRSGEYGEPADEYIGILKEKSNRLKGLIEDLMEASKVSTGNVKLNLSPVNLYELAMQISGENSDDLEEKGIEIIITSPENQPIVLADSQQTWRIFENLFSNVRKYTMPGTRVYVDTTVENGYGCFSVKNISAHALNIPAEELTQRFVRADEARTGEGSGLGLSIAESLCKLQNGGFSIHIDGDLFKAKVCLPIYKGNIVQ